MKPGNVEAHRRSVETRKKLGSYKWSNKSKSKLSKTLKGRKMSKAWCKNISIANKGKKKSKDHVKAMKERPLHKKYIRLECEKLKEQGFRVIPLDGDYRIRPDIIAVKDNKIFAVEVELNQPKYNKYKNINFYDDIIWVLIKKDNL